MKAEWFVKPWNEYRGFSHEETVEWTEEASVITAEEAKKRVLSGEWYADGWTDQSDSHAWGVRFYDGDPMFSDPVETVEFWVEKEDL